jgi:hypothetical protein
VQPASRASTAAATSARLVPLAAHDTSAPAGRTVKHWKPRLKIGIDCAGLALDHAGGYLLSRMDGQTSVYQLIQLTGFPESLVIRFLRRLHEKQLLDAVPPRFAVVFASDAMAEARDALGASAAAGTAIPAPVDLAAPVAAAPPVAGFGDAPTTNVDNRQPGGVWFREASTLVDDLADVLARAAGVDSADADVEPDPHATAATDWDLQVETITQDLTRLAESTHSDANGLFADVPGTPPDDHK